MVADGRSVNNWSYRDLKQLGHHYLPEPDKWVMNDQGCDYVYTGGHPVGFMLPNGLKEIQDYAVWQTGNDQVNKLPLLTLTEYLTATERHPTTNFLRLPAHDWNEELASRLSTDAKVVIVLETNNAHAMPELRRFFMWLEEKELDRCLWL